MPIYAYRCESCGHSQDVLQKFSDPVLTECPACGKATYKKQVTAAGFQLKGSGWYVTDFRNNSSGSAPPTGVSPPNGDGNAPAAAAASGGSDTKAAPAPAEAPASAASGSAKSDSGPAAA